MGGEAAVVVALPVPRRWGTWEELLLGGAVLRHGTRDWGLVVSELRPRILCSFDFTPQMCKAKYEDLRHRFSGCTTWFEELRKQRMEELRQALEQSESSIGSLESKLETLKAEEEDSDQIDYDSSRTVSLEQVQKPNRVDSFQKDSPKDSALSSSSFTQEASSAIWSAEVAKPNVPDSIKQWRGLRIDMLGDLYIGPVAGCITKKRGKRKRKDCCPDRAKEGSVGESELVSPIDIVAESRESKETSTSDNGSTGHDRFDLGRGSKKDEYDDLVRILESIMDHTSARVFLERLDGQKKGRYKKLIRRDIDLDMIKAKLTNQTTVSSMELFRDLLLLTNNALVFYAETTEEHESALLLRNTIAQIILRHSNKYSTVPETALKETDPPLKVKLFSSVTPSKRGRVGRRSNRKDDDSRGTPCAGSPAASKGRGGRARRGRIRNQTERSISSGRGRKRARTK